MRSTHLYEKKFSEFNMTLADLRYCYLVLFHLDTISEAILLNIQPDSVNKRRQRVRQKLGIIGDGARFVYLYY